jgi:hypothetical protein
LKRPHKGHSGVLAATTSIGPPFIIRLRFQRDAEPLDARRIAHFIELYTRYPYARIISLCDQPREEIEFAIGAASRSRIQDSFYFLRIARLRFHQQSQAVKFEFAHRIS